MKFYAQFKYKIPNSISNKTLDDYIIRFIQPYPIRIGLTYEDLDDLTQDNSFDWIFDGIDIHLYNEDENPN